MRLDKFNNPIFNEVDVFNAMYAGHTSTLPLLTVDPSEDIESLANHAEIKFNTYERILETVSVSDYDSVIQHNWFMPAEYYTIDIEAYCLSKCSTTKRSTFS